MPGFIQGYFGNEGLLGKYYIYRQKLVGFEALVSDVSLMTRLMIFLASMI